MSARRSRFDRASPLTPGPDRNDEAPPLRAELHRRQPLLRRRRSLGAAVLREQPRRGPECTYVSTGALALEQHRPDRETGGKIATHNKPTAPVTTLPASTFPSSLQPTRGAGTTVLPAAVDNGDVTDSPQPATATVTATPSTAPPSPAGLPAGAVAGIAVAATVVGVATLTALAWLILRRRRKAREHGSGHGAGDGRSPFGRRAIDGGEMDATAESRELDSKMTPGAGQLDPKARPGTGELDAKAKLEARGLDPAKGHSLASHELDGSPVSPAELQRVSEMSVP